MPKFHCLCLVYLLSSAASADTLRRVFHLERVPVRNVLALLRCGHPALRLTENPTSNAFWAEGERDLVEGLDDELLRLDRTYKAVGHRMVTRELPDSAEESEIAQLLKTMVPEVCITPGKRELTLCGPAPAVEQADELFDQISRPLVPFVVDCRLTQLTPRLEAAIEWNEPRLCEEIREMDQSSPVAPPGSLSISTNCCWGSEPESLDTLEGFLPGKTRLALRTGHLRAAPLDSTYPLPLRGYAGHDGGATLGGEEVVSLFYPNNVEFTDRVVKHQFTLSLRPENLSQHRTLCHLTLSADYPTDILHRLSRKRSVVFDTVLEEGEWLAIETPLHPDDLAREPALAPLMTRGPQEPVYLFFSPVLGAKAESWSGALERKGSEQTRGYLP